MDSQEIWDDETGETVTEALARFSTFGPLLSATEVASLPVGTTVWSFGYGQDPAEFDAIEVGEVAESVDHDGAAATDSEWGPFAIESLTTGPVQAVDVVASVIAFADTANLTGQQVAERVMKALARAGVEVLAPQDLEWGTCPSSDTGHHRVSTSLCSGCLEYDPE